MRPVIRVLYLPGWRLTHAEPRASLREDKLGSEVDAYCTHQRPFVIIQSFLGAATVMTFNELCQSCWFMSVRRRKGGREGGTPPGCDGGSGSHRFLRKAAGSAASWLWPSAAS